MRTARYFELELAVFWLAKTAGKNEHSNLSPNMLTAGMQERSTMFKLMSKRDRLKLFKPMFKVNA
eukprot:CAMPEP_0115491824 /NCGR_PEP_ID=MMETSP0271-20121206/63311_1 /TAXON_ID=71861 /ORGANISM="Scrippsiella trochoidea, Strain CCMP3099" /LENGTH=64 /DNA_ID=CAMNT_0002920199 /DNA_START=23 /DNA_END=214 /DNA_ORIENTATION=+